MPGNQVLLFGIDTFLGPKGAWVEGIKGAYSSAQMSLLQHFSSSPGVCVVDSDANRPETPRAGRVCQRAVQSTGYIWHPMWSMDYFIILILWLLANLFLVAHFCLLLQGLCSWFGLICSSLCTCCCAPFSCFFQWVVPLVFYVLGSVKVRAWTSFLTSLSFLSTQVILLLFSVLFKSEHEVSMQLVWRKSEVSMRRAWGEREVSVQ